MAKSRIIRIIIGIVLAVIIVGGLVFGYLFLEQQHKREMSEIKEALEVYESAYANFYTTVGYTVADDKVHGGEILEEDLVAVEAAESQDGHLITDPTDLIGKYYRINLTAGTLLTEDVIMDSPINSDYRSFDVITSYNPIGLEVDDYVDIRFITPMGEDYVAISHKRVEGVYNGILKLSLSEYDIMVYNSLVVDKILLEGSIIYSTKYLEPGGQEPAIESYPLSGEVMRVALSSPNVGRKIDYITMVSNRYKMLESYQQYSDDEIIAALLEGGKNAIPDQILSGQSDYNTQQDIAKQEALEQAILDQQNQNGG